jgi:hypothetical protein
VARAAETPVSRGGGPAGEADAEDPGDVKEPTGGADAAGLAGDWLYAPKGTPPKRRLPDRADITSDLNNCMRERIKTEMYGILFKIPGKDFVLSLLNPVKDIDLL